MDLGMNEYTTGKINCEIKEDLDLTDVDEEIEEEPDAAICFEECFVSGFPENYPENTDDDLASEEIAECRKVVPTSFAENGTVCRPGHVDLKTYCLQNASPDQAKDSWGIEKVRSIEPTDWTDTDESDAESISAAACPVELTDYGDCDSKVQSLTQLASDDKSLTSKPKVNSKRSAIKRRRLVPGIVNFDGSVVTLTEKNKIRIVVDEEEIKALSLPSSKTREQSKSEMIQSFGHTVTRWSYSSVDDNGSAVLKFVTKRPRNLQMPFARNETEDLVPASAGSPAEIMDSNSETTAGSVSSCEEISLLPSQTKRPSIFSNRYKTDSSITKPNFKNTNQKIEEEGFQAAKQTKTDRRKQVIVCKPESIYESDVTVTDSEDDAEVVLIDSEDENEVVITDSEDENERVLTDTDDEAEILYDNDGSFITCNICYKAFDSKPLLTLHKRTHNSTQSFQCLECDVKFSTEFGLECHFCARDNLSFVCKRCKLSFLSEWDAISHECANDEQTQTCSACKVCGVNLTRRLMFDHMAESHQDVIAQQQDDRDTEL